MEMEVSESEPLLAAERRRLIVAYVRRHGAASVAKLAQWLEVAPNTVRRDLALLDSQGKLTRSHGGAVAKETPYARLPYTAVSHEHATQKALIAEAALPLLPDHGSVFLADGSTVQAFATRIPPGAGIHVVTNSVKIAVRLAMETTVSVEILGGKVRPELLATDCSLATHVLEMLFWDIAFIGAAAIDVSFGITERDAIEAERQRKFINRATRVVALCDSSKIGKCSYALVGPVSLLDTVVTDSDASPDDIQALRSAGVEVIIADLSSAVQPPSEGR
jgi:DeoR/GlpR family transcriptional regulator of sugar metabolism